MNTRFLVFCAAVFVVLGLVGQGLTLKHEPPKPFEISAECHREDAAHLGDLMSHKCLSELGIAVALELQKIDNERREQLLRAYDQRQK